MYDIKYCCLTSGYYPRKLTPPAYTERIPYSNHLFLLDVPSLGHDTCTQQVDYVVPNLALVGRDCLHNLATVPSGCAYTQSKPRPLPVGGRKYDCRTWDCIGPVLGLNDSTECVLYR